MISGGITAALRQAGEQVNHKTVQRLIQHLGLKSLVRPKKYRSYRGLQASVPNLLARQFQAERPNQRWVTDVTQFNVRGEKLYLSPVMDLYNEPPRLYRRLHILRGWSYELTKTIFLRSPGASCSISP